MLVLEQIKEHMLSVFFALVFKLLKMSPNMWIKEMGASLASGIHKVSTLFRTLADCFLALVFNLENQSKTFAQIFWGVFLFARVNLFKRRKLMSIL